jgi:hypothetical protein
MTQPVLARRFINTPTVEALYNAENPESVVDAPDDKIDDLSDEYDQVSGTESLYYQYIFSHIPRKQDLDSVQGTEGFMSWVKDMVGSLITAVKNFFKWVFSFFTGKKEVAARKNKNLIEKLDKNGVKHHFTHYPAGYVSVWASKAKIPANLDWMKKAGEDWKKANAKTVEYINEIKKTIQTAESTYLKKGQLSKGKDELEKLFKAHHDAIVRIFGKEPALFIGGCTVSVTAHGKLSLKPDPDLLEADKNAGFISSETTTRTLAGDLTAMNTTFQGTINKSTELESVFIKGLNNSLSFANTVEVNDEAVAKQLTNSLNEIVRNSMAGVKALETLLFKVYNSHTAIVESSVETKG